jgi:hypothetical protein
VSDQLVEKGRLKIFGCGAAGRHPYVRLDRAASPANAAFEALARGDVADIGAGGAAPEEGRGATPAADGLRVGSLTEVRIHEHVARRNAAP